MFNVQPASCRCRLFQFQAAKIWSRLLLVKLLDPPRPVQFQSNSQIHTVSAC
jgi:hypothetical protein